MRWNVEVDCIRQAPTWGGRNDQLRSFSSSLFPWPGGTDVTIWFGIAAHFPRGLGGRLWYGRRLWRDVQIEEGKGESMFKSVSVISVFRCHLSARGMIVARIHLLSSGWKGVRNTGRGSGAWRIVSWRLPRPSPPSRCLVRAPCSTSCKFLLTKLLGEVNKVSHFSHTSSLSATLPITQCLFHIKTCYLSRGFLSLHWPSRPRLSLISSKPYLLPWWQWLCDVRRVRIAEQSLILCAPRSHFTFRP